MLVKTKKSYLDMLFKNKQTNAESLLKRKDSILSSFKTILGELIELKQEQDAATEQLKSDIKILTQELKAVEVMSDSTEKTITKISNLIE